MSKPIKVMKKSSGGARVYLPSSLAIGDSVTDPTDAFSDILFQTGGSVVTSGNGSSGPFSWKISGVGSDYDIRVDVSAGSFTSGTVGSWLSLGTGRTWTFSRTTVGNSSVTATIQIRDASTLTVLEGPKSFTGYVEITV